ncbi:hypothetical protein YC2023_092858 [Brassica napus]
MACLWPAVQLSPFPRPVYADSVSLFRCKTSRSVLSSPRAVLCLSCALPVTPRDSFHTYRWEPSSTPDLWLVPIGFYNLLLRA